MGVSGTYWLQDESPILEFDPGVSIELGRVRSVAFIRKGYLQQLLSDPTEVTNWVDGIEEGKILVLPFTTGQFDSGSPQKGKGYGRRVSTHGLRTMQLSVQVPSNLNNAAFLDEINSRLDLVAAFRTANWLYVTEIPADVVSIEQVEDDLTADVKWSLECVIRQRNLPRKWDASSIKSVFTCEGAGSGSGGCVLSEFSTEFSCEFN